MDLKALSETCSWILKLTRQCRTFINRTQLNIAQRTPRRTLRSLGSCSFPWKTVSVEVDGWQKKEIELIKTVLGSDSVQSLELRETWNRNRSRRKLLDSDQLSHFLCLPSNLKSLCLDIGILIRVSSPLRSSEVQNRFCGLENLTIHPDRASFSESQNVEDLKSISVGITALSTIPKKKDSEGYA